MTKPFGIRPLSDFEVQRADADCLIETADCLRQIATDFGLRPYRIFLVWTQWSADQDADGMLQFDELRLLDREEGVGRQQLVREVELLPTPMITSLNAVRKELKVTGLTERGGIAVTEISMSYPEDILMGLIEPYRRLGDPDNLARGIDFWWEIRENRPEGYRIDGSAGCDFPVEVRQPARRYHVSGTPFRKADDFHWMVALTRADGERRRNGELQTVSST